MSCVHAGHQKSISVSEFFILTSHPLLHAICSIVPVAIEHFAYVAVYDGKSDFCYPTEKVGH